MLYAHRSVRSYLAMRTAMTIGELRELFELEEKTSRRKSMLTLVARRIMLLTKRVLLHRIRFYTVSKSSNRKGRKAA